MTKITVIHGQSHKGSTYNITKQILHKISSKDTDIDEYFMPIHGPDYCLGCYKCFNEGENECPHSEKVQRIVSSIEDSDIILIDSPTYCYGMTGQLKTLFDHLGYMWLPHRPKKSMFNKIAIVISTSAGSGANIVTKDLKQQLFWLGLSNTLRYNKNVNASNWEEVSEKTKKSIAKDIHKLSMNIKNKRQNIKPSLKFKFIFTIMKKMQSSNDWNMTDKNHWIENGWLK